MKSRRGLLVTCYRKPPPFSTHTLPLTHTTTALGYAQTGLSIGTPLAPAVYQMPVAVAANGGSWSGTPGMSGSPTGIPVAYVSRVERFLPWELQDCCLGVLLSTLFRLSLNQVLSPIRYRPQNSQQAQAHRHWGRQTPTLSNQMLVW